MVAWAKGGGQPCLKPLGQAAAQNPGPAPLPAQSQNIHLPFQPTSVRIKASGRRQPLLSSQLVCSLSLLLRLGIGAARGSEGEVQTDSAVGLSPPSHHAQPMLCDRLLLSEEGARTRLLQPSSLGGSPGAGGWLPMSGRISPWGASRQLLLQGIITHTVTLTQKPRLGRQVSQCSLLPALQQSWGLETAQGTDTRTFWVRNRMVFPPSN